MKTRILTLCITSIILIACDDNKTSSKIEEVVLEKTEPKNPYLLIGEKSFLTGYEPIHSNGDINVVVEIPTGSVDKWEVEKVNGNMVWEIRDNSPRKVKYLGYPGNYGMIPKTLLPKELGGDGDPLDVIVLGPAIERGSIIKAKLIGVLKLLDGGEQDDKLIAVMENTPFYEVNTLDELNTNFNGTTLIIETFFSNYKGPDKMESLGIADEKEAKKILNFSVEEYKNANN